MIIERDIYPKIQKVLSSAEAIVITGMRRVGKTTLLRFIMSRLNSQNTLYLDLENPLNQKYFEEPDYDKIADILVTLGLNRRQRQYVFLDEIQFVKNLPSVIKYLIDHYHMKFILSGSASFYLKNLFSESLSGRKYIFELFPFSFREYMRLKHPGVKLPAAGKTRSQPLHRHFARFYDDYLQYGGFPGVILKETDREKQMTLQEIFTAYFQQEVRQLSEFRKSNVVRDLMLLLMERVGSKLDIQKLAKELGDVSRITLNEYIAFLEQTYFLKLIRPFSRGKDTEIRSMPKVYICDSGLVNQLARVSEGALLENTIFNALRPQGEVHYYQKKAGPEIDFILNKRHAFEVKNLPHPRDLKKLESLANANKLASYKIVSKKYTTLPHVVYGFAL